MFAKTGAVNLVENQRLPLVDADEAARANAGVVVRAKAGNKKAALRIGHVVNAPFGESEIVRCAFGMGSRFVFLCASVPLNASPFSRDVASA